MSKKQVMNLSGIEFATVFAIDSNQLTNNLSTKHFEDKS